MLSKYILDDYILESMQNMQNLIESTNKWSSFKYNDILGKLQELGDIIDRRYKLRTGYDLGESCRILFDSIYTHDIDLLVCYLNAFLYIKKLQQKVDWHRTYGYFKID